MKFEHLIDNLRKKNLNYFKSKNKKTYFNFEVRPLIFLGFHLKNVLYFNLTSENNLNEFLILNNNKKNWIPLIILFFSILFLILFFIIENHNSIFDSNVLNLIFNSNNSNFYNNLKNSNIFFNNLLIEIIQEFNLF